MSIDWGKYFPRSSKLAELQQWKLLLWTGEINRKNCCGRIKEWKWDSWMLWKSCCFLALAQALTLIMHPSIHPDLPDSTNTELFLTWTTDTSTCLCHHFLSSRSPLNQLLPHLRQIKDSEIPHLTWLSVTWPISLLSYSLCSRIWQGSPKLLPSHSLLPWLFPFNCSEEMTGSSLAHWAAAAAGPRSHFL